MAAPRERLQAVSIPFDKGLYEGLEASTLGPGYATELENWIPESSGGLRARVGWTKASTASAPPTARNTGLGYIASPTQRILAAFETTVGTEVGIYSINKSSLAGGTWASRDTITLSSGAADHVDFALGLGYAYYTSPAFGAIRRYDGTGTGGAVTDSPANARTVAFHKSHIFAATGTTLWYSEFNDGGLWPANNFIDVGKADGEPIECLEVYADQLMIGKENSLWLLTGAGADTFALHYLGSPGCAPGRTIVRTPYGAVAAGKSAISIFSGADPVPITEPVERSYGMTGDYMSVAYIDRVCYVIDAGAARYWAYDADRRVWWRESIDGSHRHPNNLMVQGSTLYAGPQSGTDVAMFYRSLPSVTRDKDDSLEENFLAETPELWLGGPAAPITFRHLYARYRQRGGNAGQTGVTISPTFDGKANVDDERTIETEDQAGTYRVREDFGDTAYALQLSLAQSLGATEEAVMDLEAIDLAFIQGLPR